MRRLKEEPRYRFEHMDKKRIDQYAEDFRTVYNKAWAGFSGVKPITREHARALLAKMRPIIDEKLMYFAYWDDAPIGFFLMVPDLNGVIGPLGGRFGLVQKLRFLWRLKVSRKARRIFAIIFGVVPDFQGKGIESGMIRTFEEEVAKGLNKRYDSLELAWIGDFNPVMMRMVENFVCAKSTRCTPRTVTCSTARKSSGALRAWACAARRSMPDGLALAISPKKSIFTTENQKRFRL
ncbi:MAG: hypothetical protein ACLTTP_04630 [Alistipes ihumii]